MAVRGRAIGHRDVTSSGHVGTGARQNKLVDARPPWQMQYAKTAATV